MLGSEGQGISSNCVPHLERSWDALKREGDPTQPSGGACPWSCTRPFLLTHTLGPSLRRDPERQLDSTVIQRTLPAVPLPRLPRTSATSIRKFPVSQKLGQAPGHLAWLNMRCVANQLQSPQNGWGLDPTSIPVTPVRPCSPLSPWLGLLPRPRPAQP